MQRQTFKDFETIIINSSPEETTGRIVHEKFPEVDFEQHPERLYPHAARNKGTKKARGTVLVFTDPDCRARPDWLEHIVAAHDVGHQVVGGGMELVDERWFEWGIHLSKFSWLLSRGSQGPCRIICTANASYDREIWDLVGPFDGDLFTGDAILSLRADRAGFTPWFEPRAVVEHHHEENWRAYLRQFFHRGREFARARAELEQWSHMRMAVHIALTPAVVATELVRIAIAAFQSGWGGRYLLSFPVLLGCKSAWCSGEAEAFLERLFKKQL